MRKGTLLNDDVCYHMINGEHDKAMEVISRNKNVSKTDRVLMKKHFGREKVQLSKAPQPSTKI